MMKLFQKSSMKKWGFFISSIIVLSFMLWGGQASMLGDNSGISYAGKIFGRKISFEEYDKSLRQVQIQAKMRYGENYRKLQDMLNMDGQAWDRLILLREAQQRRIQVSDNDVTDAIQNSYGFKEKDGRFNTQTYDYVIRSSFGTSPRNFEEGVRDSLRIARIFEQETASVNLSDEDVLNAFRSKNQKVQVSYAIFAADELKKQVLFDEGKAKEYFEKHRDEFVMPPTVNVEFIQVDAPKAAPEPGTGAGAEPSEAQTAARDAAWDKARELYSAVMDGKDFLQVAKQNNLPVQESGSFSMEQPALKPGWGFPIVQKFFQAQTGDVLEPVETPEGYQILRIKEKKDAYLPEYEQAKEKVRENWIKSEAKNLSRQKSEEAFKAVSAESAKFKNPDFVAIAKNLNLDIQQTPVFGPGEYLPALGIAKDFQAAAFSLTEQNPLSSPVDTAKGYCFLHLDKIIPADMKEFEKEKEKLTESLLFEKRAEQFNNFLSKLRIQANLEDNIAKLKAKQKRRP